MYKNFFKRVLDILVSLIALPFVLLVLLVFAPIIYFTDKGPVFYNAPRLGKDGKNFTMYKLRSMYVNAPDIRNADGSTYNGDDDPRVTKVGRLMRKTSIDEFPQFLNVLKGDMSFIGPRAHLAAKEGAFARMSELQKRRVTVRPGITGYNQAYYRNSVSSEEKMKNDVYYVDHLTFWLDVKVLFKTVVTVLKRDNIYVTPNAETAEKAKEEVGVAGK